MPIIFYFDIHVIITLLGNYQNNQHWTLGECVALTFRSLIMLGVHDILDTDRKKVLAVSMMWGGMVLYWFWESTLISYLIIPIKDFPFHSLEEFYTNTDMKVDSKHIASLIRMYI